MKKTRVPTPKGHSPQRDPNYSEGIIAEGKRLLFVAGQAAGDESGNIVGIDDLHAQLKQTLDNMKLVLEEAGASFKNVVKILTFLRDYEDVSKFFKARGELYPQYFRDGIYPPNSLVIASLAAKELLIEIEAIAVMD
jgi:enamine deaminase RidA (YjgF/YER057c/UK114 family)